MTGSSRVTVRGRADRQRVIGYGHGIYFGANLDTRVANVDISALAIASLKVSERLKGTIGGLSVVFLRGDPVVDAEVSDFAFLVSSGR